MGQGERRGFMSIVTVFFQMLALLIMIGVGFFAARTGMLDAHTNQQMSHMIVLIFNPLLIVSNAIGAAGQISSAAMGKVALIACGMFLFFIVCGMLLSPLFERTDLQQRKIFQTMFVFSNLGFIGIPVVSSILGAQYVVYVTEFVLIYTLVFYTYGIALMDGQFSAASVKAMVNPGMVCGIAALAIILFEIPLPGFLKTSITYLGGVASPMALVAVGFTLAHADLKTVFGQPRLYVFSVVKLLVLPLLLLPILRMVTKDAPLAAVCMIMFGMPIGNMPLILGNERGIDGTTCGAAIILTTILCVFTVPVLMAAVQSFV